MALRSVEKGHIKQELLTVPYRRKCLANLRAHDRQTQGISVEA
jgi:hypothetical protein